MKRKEDINKRLLNNGYNLTVYWYDAIYAIAIVGIFIACLELFYRMIVDYNGKYVSDMQYYAVTVNQLNEPHDRLLTVLFQFLYDLNENTLEINIYLAFVIAAIVVVNYAAISWYISSDGYSEKVPRYAIEAASFVALFAGPIYAPLLHEYYYKKSFQSFAWHSPTQQSMTLLAMISSLCFLKMYMDYRDGVKIKWWAATAVTTLFATGMKPSYTINLMITCVVMFLIDLVSGGKKDALIRFRKLFVMGLTLIPSGLYIIWLHNNEFTEGTQFGEEHSVVIGFSHVLEYDGLMPAILFGMAVPLVIYAGNLPRLRDTKYKFALWIFLAGLLQWAMFTETGTRGNFGNFAWGRTYGTYYLTLTSICIALEIIYDKDLKASNNTGRKIYIAIISIVIAASVFSQLHYFYIILSGRGYWN